MKATGKHKASVQLVGLLQDQAAPKTRNGGIGPRLFTS